MNTNYSRKRDNKIAGKVRLLLRGAVVLALVVLVIGIALGFVLREKYERGYYGQVNACIAIYSNVDGTDPDVQTTMKEEGFKTVKELIKDRCKHWVRSGQKFVL